MWWWWCGALQALGSLKTLINKDIVRQRASTRLQALRNRVASATGSGKDAMREMIEEDHRLAITGAGATAGGQCVCMGGGTGGGG